MVAASEEAKLYMVGPLDHGVFQEHCDIIRSQSASDTSRSIANLSFLWVKIKLLMGEHKFVCLGDSLSQYNTSTSTTATEQVQLLYSAAPNY